jgi:hypothetical protein
MRVDEWWIDWNSGKALWFHKHHPNRIVFQAALDGAKFMPEKSILMIIAVVIQVA